jgi:hypothetical protein
MAVVNGHWNILDHKLVPAGGEQIIIPQQERLGKVLHYFLHAKAPDSTNQCVQVESKVINYTSEGAIP